MDKISKQVSITRTVPEELSIAEQHLLKTAREAAQHAYAPYSRFRVGAGLQLDNGQIIVGNNQENAAYPSGLCAERVAVFAAGAQFPGISPVSLAIVIDPMDHEAGEPGFPCGSCLQVLSEYEKRFNTRLVFLLAAGNKVYRAEGTEQFLPFSFSSLDHVAQK